MDVSIQARHKKLRLPQVRLSVVDQRLQGEPWVAACTHPGLLVVYLNNHPITLLPGTSFDRASLNQILYTLRHRNPRRA